LESAVLIDYQCRQPVFFRARHFILPLKFKRRRTLAPAASSASEAEGCIAQAICRSPSAAAWEAVAMGKKKIKPNYRRRVN